MATLTPEQVRQQFGTRFAGHFGEGKSWTGDANTAFTNESNREGYTGGGMAQGELDSYFLRRERELGLTSGAGPGAGSPMPTTSTPGVPETPSTSGTPAPTGGSVTPPAGAPASIHAMSKMAAGSGGGGGPVSLQAPGTMKPLGQRVMPQMSASLAGMRKVY